ncbi:MAG: UPF0175 family protein [Deltaproteobacteria bacterium]|nr:UPF0175 family protein [Deltaproteobacteria bacterium]
MPQASVQVEIPRSALSGLDVRDGDLPALLRKTLAVELYREGRLSLGKAREVAGLTDKWAFLELLSDRGVSVDYRAEDAAEDVEVLDGLLD